MLGPPANPAPDPKMTIPPRPRSTMACAKWWHSCIGTMQLRCTIASAAGDRIGKERLVIRVGARAIDKEPDLQVGGGVGDCRGRVRSREIYGESAGLGRRAGFDVCRNSIEHLLASCQQHDIDTALGESCRRMRHQPRRKRRRPAPTVHTCWRMSLGSPYASPTVVRRTWVNRRRAMRQPSDVRTISSS